MDGGKTVYGFNPNVGTDPAWLVLDRLKNGDAFPGVVNDDTAAFAAAQAKGLLIAALVMRFPSSAYREVTIALDDQRNASKYSYGFPNSDGDGNCITWLERLGLPLLTGRVTELVGLPAIVSNPSRRFGHCV